jgi:hypothetical protein
MLAKVRSATYDTGVDGSKLAHKGVPFMTLVLLPLNQRGYGPRNLEKMEIGNNSTEKEQATLQMTNNRSP